MILPNDLDPNLFCRYLDGGMDSQGAAGIFVYLQPQVALNSKATVGAEALVRFRNYDGTIFPPATFLPLVDRLGWHDMLLQAVLKKTGEAIRDKRGQLLNLPGGFRVAVNVDATNINWHLPRLLRQHLISKGVPAEILAIELTETAILKDIEASREVLSMVQDMGVAVYIDDFGTGYSCFGALRKLPISGVKIPRDFIRHCNRDKDLKILVSLCGMLKNLNLRSIAEGVETQQQQSLLEIIGCYSAQGFHISHPLAPEEFAKFL